jgi:hypothetical protein
MIKTMVGKVFVSVLADNDSMTFKTDDGWEYTFMHYQSCCEYVRIEDIVGDVKDLIDSPLTLAEEVSGETADEDGVFNKSYTWTYYKFATVKGYVDVRWLGESNGYYSEAVHLKVRKDGEAVYQCGNLIKSVD